MSDSGYQLGQACPDFSLPNQTGADWSLREALKVGLVVLVFYRGHWCPYCRRYLGKLSGQMDRLTAEGAQVVAVSPDPVQSSRALVQELALPFTVLSDSNGALMDRFEVRNGFSAGLWKGGGRVPHPAVMIITPDSIIRFRSVDKNYKKRTTMRSILAAVVEARSAAAFG